MCCLLRHLDLLDLDLLDLLDFDLELPLLFLLASQLLLLLSRFLRILSVKSVFLLFDLTLPHLLSLLFLQLANQSVPLDVDALEAFPEAVRHAFEVGAE